MNTEASKKQFIAEYDSKVDFLHRALHWKDLNPNISVYERVNYRMIQMFKLFDKQEFDVEDVDLEIENTYYWKNVSDSNFNLTLHLTIEQYLELLQSSVTTSNKLFLMYLNNMIEFKIENKCEQEDCCLSMVNEPTKLEYYLNLIERIASINHHYGISLRTQELEEEINTIIKQKEF